MTGMRVRCDNAYLRPGSTLDLWLDRAICGLGGIKDPRSRTTKLRMAEKIATHVGNHPEMGPGLFADFTIKQMSDEVGKSFDRIGDLLRELAGEMGGEPYIRLVRKGRRNVGASVYELLLDPSQIGKNTCQSVENYPQVGENEAQTDESEFPNNADLEFACTGETVGLAPACQPFQDGASLGLMPPKDARRFARPGEKVTSSQAHTFYASTHRVDDDASGLEKDGLEDLLAYLTGCWANQQFGVKAGEVSASLLELLSAGFSWDAIRRELWADSRTFENVEPRFRPRPKEQALRLRNRLLAALSLHEMDPIDAEESSNESIEAQVLTGGPWPAGSYCKQLESFLLYNAPEAGPYLDEHHEDLMREIVANGRD